MSEGSVAGGCYCGQVRFRAQLPSRFVAHCHCVNCQRAHGAGFVTWAGFPDEQFRLEAGEAALTNYPTETDATRSFCATCGTTLFYRSPRWEGEVHVAVAVCDDALDRAPQAHVYADRAATWCPIGDALPRLGGDSGTDPME